jgi:hypothetical protein
MYTEFDRSIQILKNTPHVIKALLLGLDKAALAANEGDNSWCSLEVVAHLIANEQTNFFARIVLIIGHNAPPLLTPFDMEAQKSIMQDKSIEVLLNEFKEARNQNIAKLLSIGITADMLNEKGIHPKLGMVTVHNILSTWAAHDLSHIAHMARVLAKQHKTGVGGFVEYLSILNKCE